MEGRFQNKSRKLRTKCYVLLTPKLTPFIPNDDERNLKSPYRQESSRGLHGRHHDLHKNNSGTPRSDERSAKEVTRQRPIPQTRKMLFRSQRSQVPWSNHQR